MRLFISKIEAIMSTNEKIMSQNNEIEIDANDLPELKNGKTILRTLLQPFELSDCMKVTAPSGEIVKLEIISAFISIAQLRLVK